MTPRNRSEIPFAAKDEPLREDVSVLGSMVGDMLREQGGAALFDAVEAARGQAIARRESGATGLAQLVSGLAPDRANQVIRAFSSWFQMANLAERVHRIRRRRDYLRDHDDPQPGSIEACMATLKASGMTLEQIPPLLEGLFIEPVFTAHPTEAMRRTILEKHQAIARHLVDRMDPSLTPPESTALLAQIRAEMTAAWQTVEHPGERLTVADELENVLFFVTDVIYRIIPPFYEAVETALEKVYGEAARRVRVPTLLRFASWVGGDMDGNPNVTADTIRKTLAHQRDQALRCYKPEVYRLSRQLSQSANLVSIDPRIARRVETYTHDFPVIGGGIHVRHMDMYYRRFLRLVEARLDATRSEAEGAYESVDAFLDDLRLVADSLADNQGSHAGLFAVRRLLRRAETFGFHLATLDVRQDALVHRRAVGAGLGRDDWLDLESAERTAVLLDLLQGGAEPPATGGDQTLDDTLAVFRAIGESRQRYGDHAIGPYIISMARDADDVLSVLLLAAWAGLADDGGKVPLDVAPLFETVDDLENGPAVMDALLDTGYYREHLSTRSDRQMIMVGYSDSNKDGGMAASRWALREGQSALARSMETAGVELTIFHGRGGTISRGGGNTYRAVRSAPRGTVNGRLRVTEQGEIINAKFGLRGIAARTLEQTLSAVAVATGAPRPASPEEPRWQVVMNTVASQSRTAYRRLVYEDPQFTGYFRLSTPIDVIERMQIGSRPASRRPDAGIEGLRAIPWVFAWTQSRQIIPGWFGVGSGLQSAIDEHGRDIVAEMIDGWMFFANLVSDLEMVLAKADMDIAARYARLAGPRLAYIFDAIRDEFDRTCDLVLDLKGASTLLDAEPVVQRAIRLRNPYVDPMSMMQVDLLRRWRETGSKDHDLERALVNSVNGIAQGLQNTG